MSEPVGMWVLYLEGLEVLLILTSVHYKQEYDWSLSRTLQRKLSTYHTHVHVSINEHLSYTCTHQNEHVSYTLIQRTDRTYS